MGPTISRSIIAARALAPSWRRPLRMLDSVETVFIVDDDEAVRSSLKLLMKSAGFNAETFDTAAQFLESYRPDRPGCLVLDIRMPGMSGLDLQEQLNQRQIILPIIFITGHGDVPMAVKAMQNGAIEFIQKPFCDRNLLDRIQHAMEQDRASRKKVEERHELQARLDELTPREREVIEMVADGKANKIIAGELDVSQRTVEIHRARGMEKMRAKSVAELVRVLMTLRK